MKGAIAALAALAAALHKHGVTYVTMGGHTDGVVSLSIQCGNDAQLAIVIESLGLPPAKQTRSADSYWHTTGGTVGAVRIAAYGPHRPLSEIAAVDAAAFTDVTAAATRAAEELRS